MFSSRLGLLPVEVAAARDRANSTVRRAWITGLNVAIVSVVAFAAMGCGSAPSSPKLPPAAPVVLTPDSSFEPHPFALSPNDFGGTVAAAKPLHPALSATTKPKSAVSSTPKSVIDHWFYLVNGVGLPSPSAPTPPNVLTVIGPGPIGAPQPNGGDYVDVQPLATTTYGSQLWKAIQSPTAGAVFLRSSESFTTNTTTTPGGTTYPSMLLGYGATAAPMDLGYLQNITPSIYWNQSNSPTGDNSAFQQWTYTNIGQLENTAANQVLYQQNGNVGIAVGPQDPTNQWYAYPNYYLEYVVNQPNSPDATPPTVPTDPFPTTQNPGEIAAYQYMSFAFQVPVTNPNYQCTIEGVAYAGIRCEYPNLNAYGTLGTCAAATLIWATDNTPPVTSYGTSNTPISTQEFQAVAKQLYQECSYAQAVQTMYQNFNSIMNFVFTGSSVAINQLATDVAVSDQQALSPVASQLAEGIIYTVLSATGNAAAGALANIMETATDAAAAAHPGITSPLATTVGNLYSDIQAQFLQVSTAASNAETAILSDWARLEAIGPLALKTGYNGLGMTPTQMADIEASALQGYKLYVMQQLMPTSYQISNYVATTNPVNFNGASSYAEYTNPTFAAPLSSTVSVGVVSLPGLFNNNPSQTVMVTDIQENGASMFDFYNGLNGWRNMPLGGIQNLGSSGHVVTLFNDTPADLDVLVIPTEGYFAAPGYNFASDGGGADGTDSPCTLELRPYGYLPIFMANADSAEDVGLNIAADVFDYSWSTSNPVLVVDFQSNGGVVTVYNPGGNDGYSFSPTGFSTKTDTSGAPSGAWASIIKN